MRSKAKGDELYELDALTRSAVARDQAEALELIHELGKCRAPSRRLVQEAKAVDRRLRSMEGLRARLGLAPLGAAPRALAV
jgi:hypothetical protein